MAGTHQNLWAPWRMEYIRTLGAESAGGCFLCRYAESPDDDERNHVVCRTNSVMALLNRFPYSTGHLLVTPMAHKASLCDLTDAEATELNHMLCRCIEAVRDVMKAQGLNIGMNLGQCAGAGLPDHLHWHVVPRWAGDTNYMSIIGDVRVIPESLDANAAALRARLA